MLLAKLTNQFCWRVSCTGGYREDVGDETNFAKELVEAIKSQLWRLAKPNEGMPMMHYFAHLLQNKRIFNMPLYGIVFWINFEFWWCRHIKNSPAISFKFFLADRNSAVIGVKMGSVLKDGEKM
ncbi:hypothetical protein NPIL_607551 [Nephila pilipes]|uniref:Uncharacterized protein n=1 Tax=Nephila pilipes TaxID=299642 RepID=A0A8X6M4V2_NEPPI|nr:hypothetical protein NPIL_607551 [Nephila pilipes]